MVNVKLNLLLERSLPPLQMVRDVLLLIFEHCKGNAHPFPSVGWAAVSWHDTKDNRDTRVSVATSEAKIRRFGQLEGHRNTVESPKHRMLPATIWETTGLCSSTILASITFLSGLYKASCSTSKYFTLVHKVMHSLRR